MLSTSVIQAFELNFSFHTTQGGGIGGDLMLFFKLQGWNFAGTTQSKRFLMSALNIDKQKSNRKFAKERWVGSDFCSQTPT